jgi:hypothetical protein
MCGRKREIPAKRNSRLPDQHALKIEEGQQYAKDTEGE